MRLRRKSVHAVCTDRFNRLSVVQRLSEIVHLTVCLTVRLTVCLMIVLKMNAANCRWPRRAVVGLLHGHKSLEAALEGLVIDGEGEAKGPIAAVGRR